MTPSDAHIAVDQDVSLRLAWWATAWLRGEAATDHLLDAVIGDDATHTIAGLPELGLGGTPETADTLVMGLGRLRAEGATSVGTAFPAEGDPIGLGGPPALNSAALEAGQALVSDAGLGFVPRRVGAVVVWRAHRSERRQLPDIGEADRQLRAALVSTANALAELDVARWRPEVADELMNLRHRRSLDAPPSVPTRCVDLAARALQAYGIVTLGWQDDRGALMATEMAARRTALRPLERAARHALTAAGSPEAWPPG